jgi:hypothetical protein
MAASRTFLSLACSIAMLQSAPVIAADALEEWEYFQMDRDFGIEDGAAWNQLGSEIQMGIGMIQDAYWTLAWRKDGEVGVLLRYVYATPVSPGELPGPGPMKSEEVETTFHCANRTVRIHSMYLYRPDNSYIGAWYDPDVSKTPQSFDGGSIMDRAYSRVC